VFPTLVLCKMFRFSSPKNAELLLCALRFPFIGYRFFSLVVERPQREVDTFLHLVPRLSIGGLCRSGVSRCCVTVTRAFCGVSDMKH